MTTRVKTLNKILAIYGLALQEHRYLTVAEIADYLGISRSHAYNYHRALMIFLTTEME
jgi:Mn-dependent DtxR family transcriptional regulator